MPVWVLVAAPVALLTVLFMFALCRIAALADSHLDQPPPIHGKLSEPAVYKQALSRDEVAILYSGESDLKSLRIVP